MALKGFKTKHGAQPRLAKLGLIESDSGNYKIRTFYNVKNSDGTIRFAYDFMSPGEICTLKAIKKYNKPHFDINIKDLEDGYFIIFDILDWLRYNDIRILNIAGNSGSNKKETSKIFSIVRKNLKFIVEKYNEGD